MIIESHTAYGNDVRSSLSLSPSLSLFSFSRCKLSMYTTAHLLIVYLPRAHSTLVNRSIVMEIRVTKGPLSLSLSLFLVSLIAGDLRG